ncbi:Fc.00g008980.m01.CDS01 [Cosmosporella sp. VM-42]
MGGRQIRPARVFQTITDELNHRVLGGQEVQRPPWYNVMHSVPPSETLVRPLPTQHRGPNRKAKKPKNLFRPQRISYLEDSLRTTFYKDHPWELARPRIVIELDGRDYQLANWAKGLRQRGLPLTGESVVQRQMWLMENQNKSKRQAYDITRREFYRLRQEEEIEKRVALEEAKHVGAYFGHSRIDVAHMLEDREFENWKIWAGKETERQESQQNAQIDDFGTEAEAEAEPAEEPAVTTA